MIKEVETKVGAAVVFCLEIKNPYGVARWELCGYSKEDIDNLMCLMNESSSVDVGLEVMLGMQRELCHGGITLKSTCGISIFKEFFWTKIQRYLNKGEFSLLFKKRENMGMFREDEYKNGTMYFDFIMTFADKSTLINALKKILDKINGKFIGSKWENYGAIVMQYAHTSFYGDNVHLFRTMGFSLNVEIKD